jgi:micrococcal nuclease
MMFLLRCLIATTLLFGWASAQALTLQGVVTHVTDGDSLWIRPDGGGPAREVRLQGIDAPEICQAFGPQSREALAARVLNRTVMVSSRARDSYQRTLARVSTGGQDLNGWLVTNGYAWSYHSRRNAGPYAAEEARAREARRGLWSQPGAIEPREFRKRHGSCKPGAPYRHEG